MSRLGASAALVVTALVVGLPLSSTADGAASVVRSGCTAPATATAADPHDGRRVTVALVDSGLATAVPWSDTVDERSTNVVPDEPPTDTEDGTGHGTAMAGIVHDHAPRARLLIVRALDDRGGASPATVAAAVRAATAADADVINLSLSGAVADPGVLASLRDATDAGAVVVIAAGNDHRDLDRHPGWDSVRRLRGVVVVAAAGADGRLGASSNWGADTVDVAAPGTRVRTWAVDGGGVIVSGSSAAAARVSALLADLSVPTGARTPDCDVVEQLCALAHPRVGLADRTRCGLLRT